MARLIGTSKAALAARYGLDPQQTDAVGVIEAVARKRGCLRKGRHEGEFDMAKASIILLTDCRSGSLGRVSLETPESRAAMLAAVQTA